MNIGKAAVLGAGTMGAGIAAHLANAGIPTTSSGHRAEGIERRRTGEKPAARFAQSA